MKKSYNVSKNSLAGSPVNRSNSLSSQGSMWDQTWVLHKATYSKSWVWNKVCCH